MGQIIRWIEADDFDATSFHWNHLLLAGDPANARPEARGTIRGDFFGSPDGLAFDPRGLLWVQTDVGPSKIGQGEHARIGHNQMLACDLASGEVRRFLTGPAGCEITGAAFTPDATTMFVNVQHPGEAPRGRNDPADPMKYSRWPDGARASRPRSATLAIRRRDGGPVGS
jgi:secreted PhoX family phosphatase